MPMINGMIFRGIRLLEYWDGYRPSIRQLRTDRTAIPAGEILKEWERPDIHTVYEMMQLTLATFDHCADPVSHAAIIGVLYHLDNTLGDNHGILFSISYDFSKRDWHVHISGGNSENLEGEVKVAFLVNPTSGPDNVKITIYSDRQDRTRKVSGSALKVAQSIARILKKKPELLHWE
jgi:hypothetical protein